MCAVTSSGNEAAETSGLGKVKKGGFHKALKSKTSWLPKFQLPKGRKYNQNICVCACVCIIDYRG